MSGNIQGNIQGTFRNIQGTQIYLQGGEGGGVEAHISLHGHHSVVLRAALSCNNK
jgi:hypothetical protein